MSTPADASAADRRAAAMAKQLQADANAIHERLLAALLRKDLHAARVEFEAGAALLRDCRPPAPIPSPAPPPVAKARTTPPAPVEKP